MQHMRTSTGNSHFDGSGKKSFVHLNCATYNQYVNCQHSLSEFFGGYYLRKIRWKRLVKIWEWIRTDCVTIFQWNESTRKSSLDFFRFFFIIFNIFLFGIPKRTRKIWQFIWIDGTSDFCLTKKQKKMSEKKFFSMQSVDFLKLFASSIHLTSEHNSCV